MIARSTQQLFLSVLLSLFFSINAKAQVYEVCDCVTSGQCPVPIKEATSNPSGPGGMASETTVALNVNLPGTNNIAQCPLEKVCLTITHTWVGELTVSLASPAGKNYFLMADTSNNYGGCGINADNIEICLVPGTGNPIANNSEYTCNTGPCSLGTCCLNGDFTLPCGGVSTEESDAVQAPFCDLNDFNKPGDPVNGNWVLTIFDLCPSDIGTLENFSLYFACDDPPPNSCLAAGGYLSVAAVSHCFGDPALLLNPDPKLCDGTSPPTGQYGYTYFIVRNDTILEAAAEPDLSTYLPGEYLVKGISYELAAEVQVTAMVGSLLSEVLANFLPGQEPFCGSFSGNEMAVSISGEPISVSCSSINVNAGQDKVLNCQGSNILLGSTNYPFGEECVQYFWRNMAGDTLNQNSLTYFGAEEPGGYVFTFHHPLPGCTISDTVQLLPPSSPTVDAGPDTVLGCWSNSYWAQGSVTAASGNVTHFWTDASGTVLSDSLALLVNVSGVYTLHGEDESNGCEFSDEVEIIIPPTIIEEVETSPSGCDQATGTATVLVNPAATNVDFSWSTGGNTPTIGGLEQGWYSVTVTDDFCSYHQNFYVDEDLSCKVVIAGHVWDDDATQDCTVDGSTMAAVPILLHLLPADIYTYTMPDGSYEFVVDAGSYTINYIDEDEYELICPVSGMIAVDVPASGSVSSGNDFFVKQETENNVCVMMCQGPARPGFLQSYHFQYCNFSDVPLDVDITFQHDPLLQDFNLAAVADSYDPATDVATWAIPQVQPGECGTIHFKLGLPASVPLGTLLYGTISIEPVADDIYPYNNTDEWAQTVVGAYDPNIKTTHTGQTELGGAMTEADSVFSYQIFFQNTGTDTAFTVVVRDTLDENLDVESIRPGLASHNYYVQFERNNVLVFHFPEIMLPDSNINEPASHGFATFTIRPYPNLPVHTEIENRAAIFFDYNVPVITNATLHYVPVPVFVGYQSASVCAGANYEGEVYFADTTLVDTLHFADFDSVVFTSLTVLPLSETSLSAAICSGENYTVGGQVFGATGEYAVVLQNANGCDSTVSLNLEVKPVDSIALSAAMCEGDTTLFDGQILTDGGTYTAIYQNIVGCDSTVILQLDVLSASSFSFEKEICAGEIFEFNGEILTASGAYEAVLVNANGCDSTVTLQLEVLPADSTFFTQQICEGQTYLFDGMVLDEPGLYDAVFQNASGCDSAVTLQLEVLENLTFGFSAEICAGEIFEFNGQLLTESGNYTADLQSSGGCDSTVTLELEVLQPNGLTFFEEICEGESYVFHGQTLSAAGNYTDTLTNVAGCDSVVVLVLGVLENSGQNFFVEICEGEEFVFNGQVLTGPGIYADTLENAVGCDSIVALELTVWETSAFAFSDTICDGSSYLFYGDTLTTTGEYSENLSSIHGCDSTFALSLFVTAAPEIVQDTAVAIGAAVFGVPVFSDTIFSELLLDENGCDYLLTTNVSVFVNANENLANTTLKIQPNPNAGQFQLHFETAAGGEYEILIFDALGRQVFHAPGQWLGAGQGHSIPLNVSTLPDGTYWLEMRSEQERVGRRFVKQR